MSDQRGKRHPLLLYQRAMDRIWKAALALGLLMALLRFLPRLHVIPFPPVYVIVLLTVGAVMALAVVLFAFLAARMAYVQAQANYLVLVTPFLRLKISYRRLRSVRPIAIGQLFPKEKLGYGRQVFLEPFMGKTAVVLEMKGLPMSPVFLRLFLTPLMFLPGNAGLILLVDNWMALSTEIDSMHTALRHRQQSSRTPPPSGYGLLGNIKRK